MIQVSAEALIIVMLVCGVLVTAALLGEIRKDVKTLQLDATRIKLAIYQLAKDTGHEPSPFVDDQAETIAAIERTLNLEPQALTPAALRRMERANVPIDLTDAHEAALEERGVIPEDR